MNIRSMIKHVAAIITAVGMLLASMAGAVTALAEDSKPTTAVDGPTKPVRIMDNLYQTRYTGDYKLDDYLSANAGGNDDYLAWLRANLNHGKPIPLSTTQACTTLASWDAESARPEPIFPSGQQYARDNANSQNMTTHISLINVWIGPST